MTLFEPRDERATGETRRVWWKETRVVVTALGIVLLIAVTLIWKTWHAAPADEAAADVTVSVQVAKAERGAIANEVVAVATLAAQREAAIMPKITAPIARMALLKNRSVHAGEVLAVLESHDLTAQRSEAAAAVVEARATAHSTVNGSVPLVNAQDQKSVRDARATLENAKKTLERRQTLFDQGGISKKELEASQLAVTQAEDDLQLSESSATLHQGVTNGADITAAEAKARQASSRLTALDAQLGYAEIRAPFDGTITEQFQYQGELATPGAKMLTIVDDSTLVARMQIGEAVATTLQVGDRVKVSPDDLPSITLDGTISLVGRGADAQSRSVDVWVVVPNPGGRLRPNGVARVVIAAQPQESAIVVPSSAVTLDATNGTSGTVMVVDDSSVAHEKKVTIGAHSGGRTQITSGLKGGETVVSEGNYGLPDGAKVALPGAEPAKGAPTE
jgi:multidrug efflux pump subunit AcrA (membrane-fusion protein)